MTKILNKAKRILSLVLVAAMIIPSNISTQIVNAEESVVGVSENNTSNSSGFTLGLDWGESEYKDGNSFDIYEDSDTSNSVRLRVNYSNKTVAESIEQGEIIITVKGIGNVNRNGAIEAEVGADKASEGTTEHDWSYTWNRFNDTYTFTNNKSIDANTVISGYFDLVWDLNSKSTIHGYSQDDVAAEMLLPDGTSIVTPTLSFSNTTVCDEYTVDVERAPLYSGKGVSGDLSVDDYSFVKYTLASFLESKSRGVLYGEEFIFDPDVEDFGTGAVVTYSSKGHVDLGDGTYRLTLLNNREASSQYVVVAYPKDTYVGNIVKVSLSAYGIYCEGDNNGVTSEVELASDVLELVVPVDFDFLDPIGIFYNEKESANEYLERTDGAYASKVEKYGGHVSGSSMKDTVLTFYYECGMNAPFDGIYTIEMVDDYLYIAQNDGNFRQLTSKDFEYESIDISSTEGVRNENGFYVESGKYKVKIYAVQDDTSDVKDVGGNTLMIINDSTLVWEGLWMNYPQNVLLPSGTTSVAIRFENLEEAAGFNQWSILASANIRFHLDDEDLDESSRANLSYGSVANVMYFNYYDGDTLMANGFTEDLYPSDVPGVDFVQNDLDIYGGLLDREKGSVTFYDGAKSDFCSFTDISSITREGSKYLATMTIGGDFTYTGDETPDKFSLYTLLPENVYLYGYSIPEDVWNVITLNSNNYQYCTPEVIRDYNGSGRTFIALHFDLPDTVGQRLSVRAYFTVNIDRSYFKGSNSSVNVKSAVMVDEYVNSYDIGKVVDDGSWNDDSSLSCDIDGDGDSAELLAYSYDYSTYTYADSGELQLIKSVKASSIDYYTQLPEVPFAEMGSEYSYEVTLKNGNNTSKNIIIKDILETGENAEWQGTFQSVDLSEAEKMGIAGTVWYSDSSAPGEIGGDDWSTSMNAKDVKAVAVDFGTSELRQGEELSIYINMVAPDDSSLREKITENGVTASFIIGSSESEETKYDSLESNLVQVKLSSKLGNLVVTKVDEEDGTKLQGAKFALLNKDTEEVVDEAVTNANGQIVFKSIPFDMAYVLREVEAPYGYELGEDVEVVFINDTTVNITVEDKRKEASIILVKSNSLDSLVKVYGAEYTLFTEDGVEVQKAVTDINGKITFDNVEWGDYYIKETNAPEGYQLDETEIPVSITSNNVEVVQKFSVTDNQSGSTSVKLTKYVMTTTGVQTEIPLSGAAFELINVTGGRSSILGTYVTDKNGEIVVQDLAYGNYLFREIRVPAGFEVTKDIEFSITSDNNNYEAVAYDKRKTGSIYLYKKDDRGSVVSGAVFELFDEDKNIVLGTYTTDDTGIIKIEDLEWGKYYLKEKSTLDCYILSNEWFEVTIEGSCLNVDIECINETKKGVVHLVKTDELGLKTLAGAEFSLYADDGTLLQEGLVTDENGKLTVSDLDWGKYYFKETKAPTGYGLTDETVRFVVNSFNVSTEQYLYVKNPKDSKTITVTKKILVDDINFDNGDPTFLFCIEGTDIHGDEHIYYRIIRFDSKYVFANADKDGFISQSVTVSNVLAGEYVVSEEESSRYELDNIIELSDNATISGNTVIVDLTSEDLGSCTFVNGKYEHGDFSDNGSKANSIKREAKMTGIVVNWIGDTVVQAKDDIDRSLIEVKVVYDDGSTKDISSDDWSFGSDFSGVKFPNVNGLSRIPIIYTEGGNVVTDYLEVTITGARKEPVRLEASVKEEYYTRYPNVGLYDDKYTEITLDMFDVVAVYSDGSKEKLSYHEYPVITSPNYPDKYPFEFHTYNWEETITGANSIRIEFSSDSSTVWSNDKVKIYDENGSLIKEVFGSDLADLTLTVAGDYVRICMDTVGFGPGKSNGFSATLIPLDQNGNKLQTGDYVIDTKGTPSEEGIFTVGISLNPDVFDGDISTTVNMMSKYPVPVLVKGSTFRKLMPSGVTSVISTDEVATEGYTLIDLSEYSDGSVIGWVEDTTMYISSQRTAVKVIANEDCSSMFNWNFSIEKADLTYLDVSRVKDMRSMFNFSGIVELDVSGWDTSSCTNMSYMFNDCTSLTSLDVSGWDTSSCTNMSYMFNDCESLTSLDVSSWDTSSCTNMSRMFYGCTSLEELDVSNWDTSSVKSMSEMFSGTGGFSITPMSIKTLDVSKWDTSSCTNMSYMFNYCESLTALDISSWDTSSCTNMSRMFYGCSSLEELDVSKWDTSLCSDMLGMFKGCTSLEELDVSNWDVSNVTTMSGMFSCGNDYGETPMSINKLDVSSWDTSSCTNMSSMFYGCQGPGTIDVSSWDVSKVTNFCHMFSHSYLTIGDTSGWVTSEATNMDAMFHSVQNTTIDVSNFITNKVTTFSQMFENCVNLVEIIGIENFNTTGVDGSGCSVSSHSDNVGFLEMFSGCHSLEKLDLSNFDTSKATSMEKMFYRCYSLRELNLSGWDTSNVTTLALTFYECSSLPYLDVYSWDTSNVTTMWGTFTFCSSLTSLDVSNWDTTNVTNMKSMFNGCTNIKVLDLSNFNTANVTNIADMFKGMSRLEKVTIGENFSFSGDGSTSCTLPTPSSTYISGADGSWYRTSDWKEFAPADVPSNEAATYVAYY